MICFRDRSFCSAKCLTKDCDRQFDEEQRKVAEEWWGGPNAPVGYMDFSNSCPDYTPVDPS